MKTYTFFYFDDPLSFRSDMKKEFVYSSSRFRVAFDAFLDFIRRSNFSYFIYVNFYSVAGRHKASQLRVFTSDCCLILDELQVSICFV